jgi:hypothetical protein
MRKSEATHAERQQLGICVAAAAAYLKQLPPAPKQPDPAPTPGPGERAAAFRREAADWAWKENILSEKEGFKELSFDHT